VKLIRVQRVDPNLRPFVARIDRSPERGDHPAVNAGATPLQAIYCRLLFMRILIVDDEPIARRILRQELVCLQGIEVVGEADNGESALERITTLLPDLVFLDIQMPLLGGFELLERLRGGHLPVVIMVTAFDQYAIRAFEAGAIDYLLKPIGPARLQQAVERAARLRRNPQMVAENIVHLQQIVPSATLAGAKAPGGTQQARVQRIVGRAGEEYFLLDPDEVLAFQASGDTVSILTDKQRYLATQNLRTLEERLSLSSFRRIHRNALVNINQIRKMSMITSQRWLITLNNGQEFVVSKRQAHNVRDVLHW
jgi:two-component system LytT family response regulator